MRKRVVVIEAVDWAMNYAQLDTSHPFNVITGLICGFVVREDRKTISIAQQYFEVEEQVRQVVTIPKKNILTRTEWALKPNSTSEKEDSMKCPDCGKSMMKGKPCATCKKKAPAKGKPMPKGATKPKRPFPLAKEELGL